MPVDSRPNFTTGEKDCAVAETGDGSHFYPLADAKRIGEGCELVVKAKKNNTGKIYIAADEYASKVHPFSLQPNEPVRLRVDSLEKVLVGAEVAEDGVEYITEL